MLFNAYFIPLFFFFFFLMIRRPPRSTLFPYTRSSDLRARGRGTLRRGDRPRRSRAGFFGAGVPALSARARGPRATCPRALSSETAARARARARTRTRARARAPTRRSARGRPWAASPAPPAHRAEDERPREHRRDPEGDGRAPLLEERLVVDVRKERRRERGLERADQRREVLSGDLA